MILALNYRRNNGCSGLVEASATKPRTYKLTPDGSSAASKLLARTSAVELMDARISAAHVMVTPGLATSTPGLATSAPGLATSAPGLAIDSGGGAMWPVGADEDRSRAACARA
jgi:hypothetical protein